MTILSIHNHQTTPIPTQTQHKIKTISSLSLSHIFLTPIILYLSHNNQTPLPPSLLRLPNLHRMPQVDLSSVCGAHERKACETTAGDISDDDNPAPAEVDDPQTTVPDYAPQSFWLSKDAEIDWLDQNAFIERKDSGKGSVISIPNSSNLHPNSTSGSQRYSVNLKSKASIIGLPKPQKPNYVDRRNCRPASIRLFPKRPGPVSGRPAAVSEPSSPKVSCMGRVRSRKDRSRRGKNRKKQTEPVLLKSRSIKEKKPGFWNNFRLMFRSKGPKTGCKADGAETEPVKKSSRSDKKRGFMADNANGGCSVQVGLVEPPGLGGVKRFASGRRSDAWAGDAEVDGAKTEPLDRGSIWRRRDRFPPEEVNVERNWQAAGPASI